MKKFLAIAILMALTALSISAKLKLPTKRLGNDTYYYYEVKKNETVHDIANKIGVSKEIILKFNPSARNGVAKKQLLFLPVSEFDNKIANQSTPKRKVITGDVATHTVKSGESIYGISRTYGVSESDLVEANPSLSQGLQVGDQLIIPVSSAGDTSSKIVYHTVKSGETLYGLAKVYNTTIEKLIELNPGISGSNLKVDEVLMICPNTTQDIIVQRDIKQFIPYIVANGDTYESVAAANGVSVKVLRDANPDMKKLKKGKTIYIPRDAVDKQVVNTSNLTEQQLEDNYKEKIDDLYNDIHIPNKDGNIVISIILPFQLEMKNRSTKARDYEEFYNGFYMALDSLKSAINKPLSVNVYDTRQNLATVDSILSLDVLKKSDIIIAPSEVDQLHKILNYGMENNIEVLNCFVTQSDEYLNNQRSMQVNTPSPYFNASIIDLIHTNFQDYELVLLEDPSDSPKELYVEIKNYAIASGHLYKKLNIVSDLTGKTLSKYLDPATKYLFIPSNGSESFLRKYATGIIEAKSTRVDCQLELLGPPEYTMYIKKHKEEFMNIDTHIYSRFYLPDNDEVRAFNAKYQREYKKKATNSVPNMSVFGFDVGMFLVNAYMADLNPGEKASAYKGLQTNFNFERASNWAGYINKSVRIINLTPNKSLKISDLND